MIDVLIVGSGASAVNAAWPLVEAGLHVVMIDVATRDNVYNELIPDKPFTEIRKTDSQQHRYFLGDNFEGIPFGKVRVGAQLTPPRQHVARDVEKHLPASAPHFNLMQSLALGGLGAAWGAGCFPFNEAEIGDWPIGRNELQRHYDIVARRIGICGSNSDDLSSTFGVDHFLLPAPEIDTNAKAIYRKYQRIRRALHREGFFLGNTRLACATEQWRGRGPLKYHDMEFWSDKEKAIWRPRYTVEELEKFANFKLQSNCLAESFANRKDGTVELAIKDIREDKHEKLTARHLVLAAGAIGSARIVLKSLGETGVHIPLTSNPYTYYPCLVLPNLGREVKDRRHSLTQLMAYFKPHDNSGRALTAQVYSYRSLLQFKLVKESPLPHRESIRLMQLLQSYYVIIGVHHEDRPDANKSLSLNKDGSVSINYRPSNEELSLRLRQEKQLLKHFRKLGCWPIKRIDPGEGSSIHYGSTLPMSNIERPLTTSHDGDLHGVKGVTIADGATFPHLPAKGLTFTLMANANRIGEKLTEKLTAQ